MTHPDNVDEETPTKKVAKVCVKRSPADIQDPMKVTGSDTQTKKTSKRKLTKDTEGVKTTKSRRFDRCKFSYAEKSGSSSSDTSSSEGSQHHVNSPNKSFETPMDTTQCNEPDQDGTFPKRGGARTNLKTSSQAKGSPSPS